MSGSSGRYNGEQSMIKAAVSDTCQGYDDADLYTESQFSRITPTCYIPAFPTQPTLPSGLYTIGASDRHPVIYSIKTIESDAYLSFADSQLETVLNDIKTFWGTEALYKQYGFTFRRGLLLYGIAGGGKSTLVYQAIARFLSQYQGIAVLATAHPRRISEALIKLRVIDPARKLLVIFEDVDAYISEFGEEALLNFLDGEFTISNSFVIATTNYPERLDRRFISRPRRFDRAILIEAPSDAVRRHYFATKLKIEDRELEQYVSATKDFTFAALTELVISVKCLGVPFDDAIKAIKHLLEASSSSEEYLKKTVTMGLH